MKTQTTTISTVPFHSTIARMIQGLDPAIGDHVVRAQTLKEQLETTTVPADHFSDVETAIQQKVLELQGSGSTYVRAISDELVGMDLALQRQVAAHKAKQNGGEHQDETSEVSAGVLATETSGEEQRLQA